MKLRNATTPIVRLAASQGLAYAGRGAAMTALIWALYASSGSAWWVSGAMLAVFGVSTAVSPWAGHMGDRHDRRTVIVVSALLAAAGFAVCAACSALGLVLPLMAVMIAASSTQGALSAAVQGAVPNLIADDDLARANSVVGACKSAGFMLGPGIGGALLALVGATGVFAAAGLALAVSAALVARVPGSFHAEAGEQAAGGRMDGYRQLMRDPWMRLLTIGWGLIMVGVGPVIVAEVVLAHHFGVGSVGYGMIAVFWDGGGVVGALAGRTLSRRMEQPAVVGGSLAIAFGFAVVGMTPVFLPVLLGMLVAGTFDAVGVVAAQNIIQRRTPDRIRSRVSAALDAVVLGVMAASFALGAPLVELLGPQGVYLAASAVTLLGTILMLPMLGGVPNLPRSLAATRGAAVRAGRRPARIIARNLSYGDRRARRRTERERRRERGSV